MVSIWYILSVLLAVPRTVLASPTSVHDEGASATCTVKTQRKPWQSLTAIEKAGYINATLCLMNSPSKINQSVAKTRWDDFQYVHAYNMPYIHGVGAFLPFHRYFVSVHTRVLKDECGYSGSMPYWDEPHDVGNLTSSSIFDPHTAFGGNGSEPSLCISDGPFANLTLHLFANLTAADYCITRNFNPCFFQLGAQSNVDQCMRLGTFEDVRVCIEGNPHPAGHGGVGGLMQDVSLSPGDPLFWLHHTYIDKLWWDWQAQNLSSRLTDMSGPNIDTNGPGGAPQTLPGLGFLSCFGGNGTVPNGTFSPLPPAMPPNPALTNYFNDGGNVTTLNHVLNSAGIVANVTIRDIMDIRGDYVCAEYF